MGYYSAVKSTNTYHNMNYENIMLREKSDTKGPILHDFIYKKCPEKANP